MTDVPDLYDYVTAQLEHEEDAAGFDGDTTTLEALARIRAAVNEWRDLAFASARERLAAVVIREEEKP